MSKFGWKWETHEEETIEMTDAGTPVAVIYLEAVIEEMDDGSVVVVREPTRPELANLRLTFNLETGALVDAQQE